MADRLQYQQYTSVIDPLGSPVEEITPDKWFAETQQPVFIPARTDLFANYFTVDPDFLAAIPPPDFPWYAPTQQPLFDLDRRQWLHPPTSIIAPPYTPENYSGAYLGTVYIIPSYLADVRVMPSYAASIRTVP